MLVLPTTLGIVFLTVLVGLAWSVIEPSTVDRKGLELMLPHLPNVWDGRVVYEGQRACLHRDAVGPAA